MIMGNNVVPEEDYIMIFNMEIYFLKSSGAAFRDKFAAVIHELNY